MPTEDDAAIPAQAHARGQESTEASKSQSLLHRLKAFCGDGFTEAAGEPWSAHSARKHNQGSPTRCPLRGLLAFCTFPFPPTSGHFWQRVLTFQGLAKLAWLKSHVLGGESLEVATGNEARPYAGKKRRLLEPSDCFPNALGSTSSG